MGAVGDADVQAQIDGFLAKYSAAMERDLREARSRLRAMFPRGYELVFDNYNALVFGISPSERSSESFISVTGYPRWITLFFLHGRGLDDPEGLLEGEGKQIRGLRLKTPQDLDSPAVQALIAQAVAPRAAALDEAPALSTVVKLISAKQRPRR